MKKAITIALHLCWLLLFLLGHEDLPYFEAQVIMCAVPLVHMLQSIHMDDSFSELLHSSFHLRKAAHIASILVFLVSLVLLCVTPVQQAALHYVLLPHTWTQRVIPLCVFLLTALHLYIFLHDCNRRERGLPL